MAGGNPSWWSMIPPSQQHSSNFLTPISPSLFPLLASSTAPLPDHHNQELPVQSWSQLLLGGLSGEEDHQRFGGPSHYQPKKLEIWETQILNPSPSTSPRLPLVVDVKQEVTRNSNLFGHGDIDHEFQACRAASAWSQIMPVSSSPPRSCITNLSSNNMLDLSYNKAAADYETTVNQPGLDHSSECNDSIGATGRVSKKARVQPSSSSSQQPLKVRKEKLGDRITALHQLVSPFGKTDTASVLLEVIGYIRFLQDQIEALSSPYLGTTASPNVRSQQSVTLQGEVIGNCGFSEEKEQDKPKDLRSRGLCLVPVSCTHQAETDHNIGAEYWAPAFGGGGL